MSLPAASTRSGRFLSVARRYVRWKMRRSFDGVHLAGAEVVRKALANGPVIVAANHVAWWDPLFAVLIDEVLGSHAHALMDEQNLARLPFFGWVGAVPIARDRPRVALAQLRASVSLLDRPGRALWIFPQGGQRPAHLRPLGVQRGLGRLADFAQVPVVPLALNYLFRSTSDPAAFGAFGEPLAPRRQRRDEWCDAVEQAIVQGLDDIDAFATSGRGPFETVIAPRHRGDTPKVARLLQPPWSPSTRLPRLRAPDPEPSEGRRR